MQDLEPVTTALRLELELHHFLPRVAEAATLGFKTQPLRGKAKLSESSMLLPLKRFRDHFLEAHHRAKATVRMRSLRVIQGAEPAIDQKLCQQNEKLRT